MSPESFDALHSLTKLQPSVITNDRLGEGYRGDYKTFERNVPQQAPPGEDWEVCMPISGSWGYKKGDDDFKSPEQLIRNLIDIASKGGNYLLNVSPTGEGTLLPESVARLKAVGKWLKINSESIYGTSASPLSNLDWGRWTAKAVESDTILYLHVFDWPKDGKLLVPSLKNQLQSANLLADGRMLKAQTTEAGIEMSLPSEAPDEMATVIVLKVNGPLEVGTQLPTPSADGLLVLSADTAYVHNNEGSPQASVRIHDKIPHIGYWMDPQAWVEWNIQINRPGRYEVRAIMSVEKEKTRFGFGLPGQLQTAEVKSTGSYGTYVENSLGTIDIDQAGPCSILIKPVAGEWQPMNLRSVTLHRVNKNAS